jgi:hypothetical protein
MNTNINKYFEVIVSNRKIRTEGERFGCSEHQRFQKKKGEGARSDNMFFRKFSTLESILNDSILA